MQVLHADFEGKLNHLNSKTLELINKSFSDKGTGYTTIKQMEHQKVSEKMRHGDTDETI